MDLLTTTEAATIMRVTPATVRRWCEAGTLPAVKPRGQWLIAESDLQAMLTPDA